VRAPILRLAAFAARALPGRVKRLLYRTRPFADVLRRKLNRAAPPGLTEVTVASGDLAGARLLLDLRSEKDLWLGTYEPEMMAALRRFARMGMVAYDVGANLGYISILLAWLAGAEGRVYAFEPLPANLERLRAHLEMNALQDRLVLVARAVAGQRGVARFWLHASGGMGKLEGSTGREGPYEGDLEVQTVDLDGFVFEERHPAPALVKIDIEGGEVLALQGMRRILCEVRPALLLELHGPRAAEVAWEEFGRADYHIRGIGRGYPLLVSPAELGWKTYVLGLPRETEADWLSVR